MTATRLSGCALVAAGTILLAGCASTRADTIAHPSPAARPAVPMPAGMVMPDGSTMGPTQSAPKGAGTRPSAAARMICSAEIRSDIATVLGRKSVPAGRASWSEHVYTCTYRLPMGAFVLSVTESADAGAAHNFAAGLRNHLVGAHRVAGLTKTAFATPKGIVALVKDNDTLQVDASKLPARFGGQQEKRNDFAYEIASDILGCWTGD